LLVLGEKNGLFNNFYNLVCSRCIGHLLFE